ncbi:Predicted cation transporter [Mycobacteroides abscessus subsp. abscessus]|nr:Predicted cation transporter [Mycobacteroides abscessus subsp. abscessus]
MVFWLLIVFLFVLLLPLKVKIVENNIELFIFIMGMVTAISSGSWSRELFLKAASDPIGITIAVILASLLLKWFHRGIDRCINRLLRALSFKWCVALTVITLGLVSSIITAIIASLLLVAIVTSMRLDTKSTVRYVVLSCFSIGLGASLTPVGEPVATIAINKLGEDFFYLINLLGPIIFPLIILLGIVAAILVKKPKHEHQFREAHISNETYEEILYRGIKIYLFVMGLTLLGSGFKPVIDLYIIHLNTPLLYWINTVSAVLDNATLAAAEMSPQMGDQKVRAVLLGLLISGGMLIPGNIPNIIAANKLGITSKEWANVGVPIGLVILVIIFAFLF